MREKCLVCGDETWFYLSLFDGEMVCTPCRDWFWGQVNRLIPSLRKRLLFWEIVGKSVVQPGDLT